MQRRPLIPARHRTIALCALGVLVLTTFAYSNHFGNTFHFDVLEDVRTNSATPNNQVYRPLLLTIFALDYWIGSGLYPPAFHVTIFAFFLILGLLLFLVLKKILDLARPGPWTDLVALAGTALFLLAPASTESVNYIFSSSEVFVTVSVLAAFALYLYRPAWRRYYLYLIPVVLGSLVKLSTVMFGPLLFVFIFLFERDDAAVGPKKKFLHALEKSAPALILSVILYLFVRSMDAPWVVLSNTPAWNYFISQPFVLLSYVATFFLPTHLSVDTDWGVVGTVLDPRVIVGVVFIVICSLPLVPLPRDPPHCVRHPLVLHRNTPHLEHYSLFGSAERPPCILFVRGTRPCACLVPLPSLRTVPDDALRRPPGTRPCPYCGYRDPRHMRRGNIQPE